MVHPGPGLECSLYVDDFLICYRSKYIHIIERHIQQCLNKLSDWADTNGFKFSSSKTVCMHLMWVMLDHPRSAIVGISSVLKFGLDPIYSFGDIAIFIFCRFGLKLPIHAHFWGVLAETRRLSHRA